MSVWETTALPSDRGFSDSRYISTHFLALTLGELGRVKEALELQQNLVKVSSNIKGQDHPDTLVEIEKLIRTLANLGKENEAYKLSHNLVGVSKTVLGKEHPYTLSRTQDLADIMRPLGRGHGRIASKDLEH
ncbi:hypothetical protein EV360DRAFT_82172 [Lentinula raphanica]|nr:hypothetical protein EV360DRAFT_82172 [Lentinula raphanica]